MANNYQISYEINALDKATAVFDKIDRRIQEMNKNLERFNQKNKNLSVSQRRVTQGVDAETRGRVRLGYELKKNAYFYDTLNKQQERLKNRNNWAKEINAEQRIRRAKQKTAELAERNAQKEIRNAERAAQARIRAEQRVQQAKMRQVNEGYSSARTAMYTVATPTALAIGASLKNTMTMEQFDIALKTLFAKDFEPVKEELLKFSYQTQFQLREANQMLIDVKKGAKGLGLRNSSEMLDVMKTVGNVSLSYATRAEDKQEIAYQIGQGFMRGKFNERQDLRVMAARGLPVYAAIEDVMGMNIEKVKAKYGAEIPAPIVLAALRYMEASPEVMNSLIERSKSLTLGWEQFREGVFLVSSEYGKIIDKSIGLREALRSIGDIMFDHYKSLNKGQTEGLTSIIKMGVVYGTLVPTIGLAVFGIKKLSLYSATAKLHAGGYLSTMTRVSAVMSAAYLATVDWNQVLEDIKQKGLRGVLEHADAILAIFLTIRGISALSLVGSLATAHATAVSLMRVLLPLTAMFAAYTGSLMLLDQFDTGLDEKLRKDAGTKGPYAYNATREKQNISN